MSSFVLVLVLVLVLALSDLGLGLCLDMELFNYVLSCITLLVTKLHKNLRHHESTILSCYVTLYAITDIK